jgi:hypothetical protein
MGEIKWEVNEIRIKEEKIKKMQNFFNEIEDS